MIMFNHNQESSSRRGMMGNIFVNGARRFSGENGVKRKQNQRLNFKMASSSFSVPLPTCCGEETASSGEEEPEAKRRPSLTCVPVAHGSPGGMVQQLISVQNHGGLEQVSRSGLREEPSEVVWSS